MGSLSRHHPFLLSVRETGTAPKNIEAMLCMYLMQNWFNLSDDGIENDIYAMRCFMHLDFLTD